MLSKAFDDESLDKWEISVTASALITKNTSNTPNTPKIFDYAMIGGRVGKANEGNSEQDALILVVILCLLKDLFIQMERFV